MNSFPGEVIEHIFSYLTSHRDHNSVSLVCKDWYFIERISRRHVFVGNCYAVAPAQVAARFPGLRVLSVKGKPHFADFNLLPLGWGGSAGPWIEAMAGGCPGLEGIRFKRMVVSDENLELIARSFPNFKSLVLASCEGFSTDGLAKIASHCRQLRELDLQENEVDDWGSNWLACFPDSFTSLESLNFSCLRSEVNSSTLEHLVARCPNLRVLRVNQSFSIDCLSRILKRAPQLVELCTGSFSDYYWSESYRRLVEAFWKCKGLKSLSGIWVAGPNNLQAVYSVCANLLNLNLSYAPGIIGPNLIKLVQRCPRLQKLWVR